MMTDKRVLDSKKILAVDDEPDILETLEELLYMCELTKAATFDEAKELLESRDFDLAIFDIMGVDGYSLLDIANRKKITTIMLTAHAFTPGNLIRSMKEGAASYLPKDEMGNIISLLIEILESKEKGESTWEPWHEKFSSSYFEKRWGEDWKHQDEEFREKRKADKTKNKS